jgi:hypothetical protein
MCSHFFHSKKRRPDNEHWIKLIGALAQLYIGLGREGNSRQQGAGARGRAQSVVVAELLLVAVAGRPGAPLCYRHGGTPSGHDCSSPAGGGHEQGARRVVDTGTVGGRGGGYVGPRRGRRTAMPMDSTIGRASDC